MPGRSKEFDQSGRAAATEFPRAVVAQQGPRRFARTLRASLFTVTALFFGGVYTARGLFVVGPHRAGLSIDPESLNFGRVWSEREFKWRIPLRNTSHQPLEISGFGTSCECTSVEPSSLVIAPGSTSEVVATIDLTDGAATTPPEAQSARRVAVRVSPTIASGTGSAVAFILKGRVRELFPSSPQELDLGEIPSGTTGEPKTVRLNAAVPLSTIIALPQSDMTVDFRLGGVAAGGRKPFPMEEAAAEATIRTRTTNKTRLMRITARQKAGPNIS